MHPVIDQLFNLDVSFVLDLIFLISLSYHGIHWTAMNVLGRRLQRPGRLGAPAPPLEVHRAIHFLGLPFWVISSQTSVEKLMNKSRLVTTKVS